MKWASSFTIEFIPILEQGYFLQHYGDLTSFKHEGWPYLNVGQEVSRDEYPIHDEIKGDDTLDKSSFGRMEIYYLNDEAKNGCLTRIDMNIPKTEVEQFEMLDENNAKKPCKLRLNGDRTIICDFHSFPMNNDVHDISAIKVKSSCERHIAGLTKSLERILSCTT